jgi:beta-glucanase (GH16 family)
MINLFYYIRFYILAKLGKIAINEANKPSNGYIPKSKLIYKGELSKDWDDWYSKNTEIDNYNSHYYNCEDCIISTKRLVTIINKYKPNGDKTLCTSKLYTGTKRFHYGYYELVAKVPSDGKKSWAAFWLWGVDSNEWPPEVDIFEFMGDDSSNITFTNHWKHGTEHKQKGIRLYGLDFSKEYYSYGLLWEKDRLTWYIGGVAVYTQTKHIPVKPMAITLTSPGYMKYEYKPGYRTEFRIKSLKYYTK